ncbi:MAG: bifunctional oligoribonuclease/PAP phosphatase NrnA [Bacteroidetes bacterium]|nr:bifunctional oligoribonuclease/PAP phosphatase NrnA [Bacteroidota bacterium]
MNGSVRIIDTAEAGHLLWAAKDIVLTTHANPDGDALGSQFALYQALRSADKQVRIINCDAPPENMMLLSERIQFETYDADAHDTILNGADLIVVLDLNDIRRIDRMEAAVRASGAAKLVIDHHLEPMPFADQYCSVPEASSTAEIIFDILDAKGCMVTEAIATGIYVGIVTDTGSFRFDRTTARLHRIVARLLEAGVDPVTTHRLIYDNYPVNRMRLLGRILSGIQQYCDGRVSLLIVTAEMFADTGTGVEDVENVVNNGLAIRGVEAAALITEMEGAIKISFRSRARVGVDNVARQFDGGGHRYAAGATALNIAVEDLAPRVAAALCEAVRAACDAPDT